MSFLKKLFGGGSGDAPKASAQAEEYKDFLIYAEPSKESGGYRVGARIEKEVGGETKTHTLIRADTIQSLDDAIEVSVAKAKQMIDEQGERLF